MNAIPRSFTWTDGKVEEMKQAVLDGFTCSKIALLIGAPSRNSVISKILRLRLRAGIERIAPPKPVKATSPIRNRIIKTKPPVANILRRAIPYHPPVEIALRESLRVSIMELTESSCRWPLGDPIYDPDFAYCGLQSVHELPYCPHHTAMSIAPPRDRRAVAE